MFTPLADRRFRLLWAGQTLSGLGDAITPVALALAVIQATGSATDLGAVLAAAAVPRLLLVLAGGVWADRLPRHLVMLTADVVNLFVQVTIGLELLAGTVHLGHLIALSALSGAASAFFMPAADGLIPATVEEDRLQQANALTQFSRQAGRVLGPMIATTLVITAGAGWAFLLDAATFAVSVGTLALLRVRHEGAPREGFWTELAGGWTEMRRHRWYWTNLIVHAIWNLASSCYLTLGPLVAVRSLGGQVAWGVITQGGALGAVVGAVTALRLRPRRPLTACNLLLAIFGLPLALLAARAPAPLVAVAAGLAFGGLTFMNSVWLTAVQQHIPARALSRVMAYDWLTSLGLTPAGLAVAGPLGAAVGTSATLAGTAGLVVAACLLVLAVPDVRRLTLRLPAPVAEEPVPTASAADDELHTGHDPGRTSEPSVS
ncbi:MFS transporter [Actinoallomurus sp. NPDC050550]|uniref:MFS transporter n=1 Tax=Actinoallomurus sp. NPDC050550 TaxID=3154937 RepID=UPI0033EB2FB5